MSSESTPVLSHAISSFKKFMTEWEKIASQHEELWPWAEIGLQWAKKYYIRMDDTDAYVITMCQSLNQYLLQRCSNLWLGWTVLNPAMRFSWIEVEWEHHYIREVKDIILKLVRLHHLSAHSVLSHDLQMWQYCNQKSSTSEVSMTDPLPPTQPAPVSGIKPAPTRLKVQDSIYNKKSTHHEFSVESEFQKYTLGSILSKETSILQF